MRIFYSTGEDPMILNSIPGFKVLHEDLRHFLASPRRTMRIATVTSGSPEPYAHFLIALELEKATGGVFVSVTDGETLKIAGSVENLGHYIQAFRFGDNEDGSHHHPEQLDLMGYMRHDSMSVVVEADNARMSELCGG